MKCALTLLHNTHTSKHIQIFHLEYNKAITTKLYLQGIYIVTFIHIKYVKSV